MQARTLALALLAAAATAGIALGAASQKEIILETHRTGSDGSLAAGNLVTLTALLPAAALAAGSLLLTRRDRRALVAAGGIGTATYVLLWLTQSQFPFYLAEGVQRTARLSLNPLLSNLPALGSVLVPIMALLAAGILLFGASARAILRPRPRPSDAPTLSGRHVAAAALAVPFLAVAAAGCLRLLLILPGAQRDTAPYLVVLPVAALACLGLAVTTVLKARHLAHVVRNPRLGGAAEEAWRGIGRAEAIMAAVLGLTALVSTLLPAVQDDALHVGLTFGMTARGHMQALLLLAVPLTPLMVVHRQALASFQQTGAPGPELSILPLAAATGAAFAGAAIGMFLLDGALWPWLFALAPMAMLALTTAPVHAAPTHLLLAAVLWGIGNTLAATFDARADVGGLHFDTDPGLLALARLGAVAVLAATVARCLASLRPDLRPRTLWPMAVGTGTLAALIALLELTMHAWVDVDPSFLERIGVGSMVAAQDPAVRTAIHLLAVAAGALAGWLTGRLLGPLRPWRRAVAMPSWQGRPTQ